MNEKKIIEEMTVKIHDETLLEEFSKLINGLRVKFNQSPTKGKRRLVKEIEGILEGDGRKVAVIPRIKK